MRLLVAFILHGTGIFLVLFYIYPIVPYALALCAQFLINWRVGENNIVCKKILVMINTLRINEQKILHSQYPILLSQIVYQLFY